LIRADRFQQVAITTRQLQPRTLHDFACVHPVPYLWTAPVSRPSSLPEPEKVPTPARAIFVLMRRNTLSTLAADRRIRLQDGGRSDFHLTDEEIERSTGTAMRLADASKSQVKARDDAGSVERPVRTMASTEGRVSGGRSPTQ
jgi:hypothetical protein